MTRALPFFGLPSCAWIVPTRTRCRASLPLVDRGPAFPTSTRRPAAPPTSCPSLGCGLCVCLHNVYYATFTRHQACQVCAHYAHTHTHCALPPRTHSQRHPGVWGDWDSALRAGRRRERGTPLAPSRPRVFPSAFRCYATLRPRLGGVVGGDVGGDVGSGEACISGKRGVRYRTEETKGGGYERDARRQCGL